MPQQRLVKIIDAAGILRQQGLQKSVGIIRRHLLPDETQANADAVNVHIYT